MLTGPAEDGPIISATGFNEMGPRYCEGAHFQKDRHVGVLVSCAQKQDKNQRFVHRPREGFW